MVTSHHVSPEFLLNLRLFLFVWCIHPIIMQLVSSRRVPNVENRIFFITYFTNLSWLGLMLHLLLSAYNTWIYIRDGYSAARLRARPAWARWLVWNIYIFPPSTTTLFPPSFGPSFPYLCLRSPIFFTFGSMSRCIFSTCFHACRIFPCSYSNVLFTVAWVHIRFPSLYELCTSLEQNPLTSRFRLAKRIPQRILGLPVPQHLKLAGASVFT
ncbi:hypothetical protein BC829DRAFT_54747 [Chytridium lagenaria]|nr:hypothetical protein BC829DRAFT_54747 [Chytridium lagenaria]